MAGYYRHLIEGWLPILTTLTLCVALGGCNLTPVRPEAVFALYRERMRSEKIEEARTMLTSDSRRQAVEVGFDFKLAQPPENLALLNSLDPVSRPIVAKAEETEALVSVRTLKGGTRIVRLVRADSRTPWQIDLTRELTALKQFLEARRALEMLRDQAGEYASSWRSFSERLESLPEEPESRSDAPDTPTSQTKPLRTRKK